MKQSLESELSRLKTAYADQASIAVAARSQLDRAESSCRELAAAITTVQKLISQLPAETPQPTTSP